MTGPRWAELWTKPGKIQDFPWLQQHHLLLSNLPHLQFWMHFLKIIIKIITFLILIDSIIFQIMKTPANKSCTAQKNPKKKSQTRYRSPWARRWSTGTPGHWCSFGDNLGTGRLHPSPCTDLHRELQGKGSRSIPGAGNVPSHHSLKSSHWKNQVYPNPSSCWLHMELSNGICTVPPLTAQDELPFPTFPQFSLPEPSQIRDFIPPPTSCLLIPFSDQI